MNWLNDLPRQLPLFLEHGALAVAAIGGVLAARGKQIDLFGVLVLALVTAFGGGTVRDLMIGDLPVAWLRNMPLVTTAVVATIVTFVVARVCELPRNLLLIADAVALALFTISGAKKALGFDVAPVIAVIMGVITGVAGGAIRDVITGQIPLVFQPHIHLYATASMVGASVFVFLAKIPEWADASLPIGIGLTLLLRLAAIRWKLGLPVFVHAKEREVAAGTNSPEKARLRRRYKLPAMIHHFLLPALAVAALASAHAELRVPAFTAYLDPNPNGASVSDKGVTGWRDPALKVLWFGEIKTPGKLECSLALRLPADAVSKLKLTVAGQSREATAKGDAASPVTVSFGSFDIAKPGYQRFELESLNPAGAPFGDLETLILDGPATADAHFNLKPRRNAASVHLFYPVPKDTKVEAFYCEVTALEDPVNTYYMATGWHRGYFGMQVNSPTERRIIFSVWDSGNEAIDRNKVADENRTKLIAKGEGVNAGDFGHEGTGGHSHLKYQWKTGEKQRFIVTAKPTDATHTIYSGFYFHPEKKAWMLISSWKAPRDGSWLRGLHSFSENFGSNGHVPRKAIYGNQWLRTSDGQWIEQTEASFSHDGTGKTDRLDRFMGVENGQFFLSHGGFVPGFTKFGEKFTRPASGKPPTDLQLPAVVEAAAQ